LCAPADHAFGWSGGRSHQPTSVSQGTRMSVQGIALTSPEFLANPYATHRAPLLGRPGPARTRPRSGSTWRASACARKSTWPRPWPSARECGHGRNAARRV